MTSAINASLALLSLKTEEESDCMHTNFVNYTQNQVKLPINPGSDVETAMQSCQTLSDYVLILI